MTSYDNVEKGPPKLIPNRGKSSHTKYTMKEPAHLNSREQMIHKMVYSREFEEQRETYKRLANLKSGGTDHTEPKTMKLKHKLSYNKKVKASVHTDTEHARELCSLKMRIQSQGNWHSRKKNPQDPLANPVWFFKGKNRDPEIEKHLDLGHYEQTLKEKFQKEQEDYKNIEMITGNLPANFKRAPAAKMTKLAKKMYKNDGGVDNENNDLFDLSENQSLKKPKKRVSYANTW